MLHDSPRGILDTVWGGLLSVVRCGGEEKTRSAALRLRIAVNKRLRIFHHIASESLENGRSALALDSLDGVRGHKLAPSCIEYFHRALDQQVFARW